MRAGPYWFHSEGEKFDLWRTGWSISVKTPDSEAKVAPASPTDTELTGALTCGERKATASRRRPTTRVRTFRLSQAPEEWGPDAKLFVKLGQDEVGLTQHTEERGDESRAILDQCRWIGCERDCTRLAWS